MKITTYTTTGTKEGEIELPLIFSTPFRRDADSHDNNAHNIAI